MQSVVYQLLPELSEEEYEALKADIAAKGIQVPIEVDEEGNVLDGYHRLRAARELGIPEEAIPKVVRAGLTEQEKREHVLRLNLLRRQLTREQKRAIALELRREGWTQTRIAQLLGVAQATVHYWLQEAAEQAGDAGLPAVIVDSLGRRQAASKPRRRFDWPEITEPSSADGLAGGDVPEQEEPGAEETAPPVWPEVEPEPEPEEPEMDEFDADAGIEDDGLAVEHDPFAVEGEASAVGGDTPAVEGDDGAIEAPAEGDAEAAGDVIETDNVEPEPEPEPEPESEPEPRQHPRWSYFWGCQPGLFPGPGRLTEDEYEMAVAFEAALNVLASTYAQADRGRKVLRAWRRWKAEQGEEQAPQRASRLLEAMARYIRTTLALSRRSGGKRQEASEVA